MYIFSRRLNAMINYNLLLSIYIHTHTYILYIYILLYYYIIMCNVLCKLYLNLWCYQMEITEEG